MKQDQILDQSRYANTDKTGFSSWCRTAHHKQCKGNYGKCRCPCHE